ncbi:hypothetical protein M2272_005637 [Mycobacterium frederiksbergense]|uniref:Secreted protein n=1 Tax=Mycolicibacterium frederiksbergense TaxID=117567 RepID=A0ABT6L7P0_9MYCO|nr:hypothetical protein [Mycolicibacterium frederiksbergense]MDH6198973.1 hypothetical protein [Mycolicibacterium frederiksbergense]
MKLVLGSVSAMVLVGAAVGLASPAAAEELNGTYRYDYNGPSTWSTWTVTPCGSGCVDVAATGGANWAPYGGQARLDSGRWTMVSPWTDAGTCDGVPVTASRKLSWDATTLRGIGFADWEANDCGPAERSDRFAFTLTKLS